MGKVRIYQLAKECNLDVKEILKVLSGLGANVSGSLSSIDEDTAHIVIELLSPKIEVPSSVINEEPNIINLPNSATLKDIAIAVNKNLTELMTDFLKKGLAINAGKALNQVDIKKISELLNIRFALVQPEVTIPTKPKAQERQEKQIISKIPVVTVMGHVDHGKTTLLDAIRHTAVANGEIGGITQRIGAYEVKIGDRSITFIDTPGHEAFTAMRARGAKITDLVLLVVAADEGAQPQTIEALNHAKAANVPVMVVVNKIDKPGADPQKVRQELSKHDLMPDTWGGKTVYVDVSAKTGQNINELLDMIVTFSDILELKTDFKGIPTGVIIESRLDKGKGPLATLILREGVLVVGDYVHVEGKVAKIRSLTDSLGRPLKEAYPSKPVEVSGLEDVPTAGAILSGIDIKEAKETIDSREKSFITSALNTAHTLSEFLRKKDFESKTIDLVVKADTHGSLEALVQSIAKVPYTEVKPVVIHKDVGAITGSDVNLAYASKALIFGFNVRPDTPAQHLIEELKVPVRIHRIIYEAIDDIEELLKGALTKEEKEEIVGKARIKATFKVPKIGIVAGCVVISGKVLRNSQARIIRDGIVLRETKIASLKRFKEDIKEVPEGMECGIRLEGYQEIREGDEIEFFVKQSG